MASSAYWKCLSRPSLTPTTQHVLRTSRLPAIAQFSTTTPTCLPPKPAAKAKAGTRAGTKPAKANKTLRIKKKAIVKTGRPPAEGERKAARKRIVLSNTNALEVKSMENIRPEAFLNERKIGKMLGIPGEIVDRLRAVEAFKTTQAWGLFRRPGVLVREETIQMANEMRKAKEGKETKAIVIAGEKGTGKSLMVLQAMTNALLENWIVINIPEAQELTSAMTDYAQIPGTSLPQQYSQNVYTSNWLSQIVKANPILNTLTLKQTHNLPIVLLKGQSTTLAELADFGIKESDIAWPIFRALWSEIDHEGRPPVCFALDGLHHIMRDSAYRDPDFRLIHAHDLAIVKLFVEYLSGAKKFTNGGCVFAATSTGNMLKSYAVDHAIVQKDWILKNGEGVPPRPDPYTVIDERAAESLKAASLLKLKGLSKVEARGLMEYWAASGVFRQRVDEGIVTEKWTLAGNGVVGEIERNALWMRI